MVYIKIVFCVKANSVPGWNTRFHRFSRLGTHQRQACSADLVSDLHRISTCREADTAWCAGNEDAGLNTLLDETGRGSTGEAASYGEQHEETMERRAGHWIAPRNLSRSEIGRAVPDAWQQRREVTGIQRAAGIVQQFI